MWKISSILAPSTQEFKFFHSWLQERLHLLSAKSTNFMCSKSANFPQSFQMQFAFKHPSAHSKRNVLLKRRAPVQVPQVSLIELQVTTSQPPKWPVAWRAHGGFCDIIVRTNGDDQRQRASCCIILYSLYKIILTFARPHSMRPIQRIWRSKTLQIHSVDESQSHSPPHGQSAEAKHVKT